MPCPSNAWLAHLGFNVFNLWMTGPASVRPALIDPGWGGAGGDLAFSGPVAGCGRLGLRQNLVAERQDELVGIDGRRLHLVTSVQLGGEYALPARFQVGGYLLPGLRTTLVRDQIDLPTLRTDYRDSTTIPSLAALMVVRWWALPSAGVHLNLQAPLVDPARALNFADQLLGLGVDARFPPSRPPDR